MRGDGAVIHHDMHLAHQLIAVFDMAGEFGQRMHNPELSEREFDGLAAPLHGKAVQVERERATRQQIFGGCGFAREVCTAKQRRYARQQMRQTHVLGDVIIRPHAQAGHGVEIAVTRGEKNNRQRTRQRAQLAAQGKAAIDLVTQPDIEQGQFGQACAHALQRLRAAGVLHDFIAVLLQCVGVVGADGGVIFNNGDAAWHGWFL